MLITRPLFIKSCAETNNADIIYILVRLSSHDTVFFKDTVFTVTGSKLCARTPGGTHITCLSTGAADIAQFVASVLGRECTHAVTPKSDRNVIKESMIYDYVASLMQGGMPLHDGRHLLNYILVSHLLKTIDTKQIVTENGRIVAMHGIDECVPERLAIKCDGVAAPRVKLVEQNRIDTLWLQKKLKNK